MQSQERVVQCVQCKHKCSISSEHCSIYAKEDIPDYVKNVNKECGYFEAANSIEISGDNYKLGALFGFVVGDVLGLPAEFEPRSLRDKDKYIGMRAYGVSNQTFGTWSDNTSLMLALIDSYKGYAFFINDFAENLVGYYYESKFTPHGSVFDVGRTTLEAIKNIKSGKHVSCCGLREEQDNGNGSLMRTLPIALKWGRSRIEENIRLVERVSSLTHAHKRSRLACIFYVYFVYQILESRDIKLAFDNTVEFVLKECKERYSEEFSNYNRLFNKSIWNISRNDIKSTGYVVDTLEASLWCFINSYNYKESVLNAVNLGGDTDTIAALTGGIAGAYYGVDKIPNRWIQVLAKKEELNRVFTKFVK